MLELMPLLSPLAFSVSSLKEEPSLFDLLVSIAWSRQDLMVLTSSVVKDDHASVVEREQRSSFLSVYPIQSDELGSSFLTM